MNNKNKIERFKEIISLLSSENSLNYLSKIENSVKEFVESEKDLSYLIRQIIHSKEIKGTIEKVSSINKICTIISFKN